MIERVVIGGKFTLMILLLVLSFINGHKEYVQRNPRKFIGDATATGLASGLGAIFLCYTRGRPDLYANSFIFSFLFFFFYSVCREFSGYFEFTGDGKGLTQGEEKQKKILKTPAKIIAGVILAIAISIALSRRVQPNSSMPFLFELILFTLIASSGEVFVGVNHGKKPLEAFLSGAILFSISHVVLQYAGFYKFLFQNKKLMI